MLIIPNIIEIMILSNVEILHAVFLWTIDGIEFLMVISFFCSRGKLVQVINFFFLLFQYLYYFDSRSLY